MKRILLFIFYFLSLLLALGLYSAFELLSPLETTYLLLVLSLLLGSIPIYGALKFITQRTAIRAGVTIGTLVIIAYASLVLNMDKRCSFGFLSKTLISPLVSTFDPHAGLVILTLLDTCKIDEYKELLKKSITEGCMGEKDRSVLSCYKGFSSDLDSNSTFLGPQMLIYYAISAIKEEAKVKDIDPADTSLNLAEASIHFIEQHHTKKHTHKRDRLVQHLVKKGAFTAITRTEEHLKSARKIISRATKLEAGTKRSRKQRLSQLAQQLAALKLKWDYSDKEKQALKDEKRELDRIFPK